MSERANDDQNLEVEDQTINDDQDELLPEDLDNVSGGVQSAGGEARAGRGKQATGTPGEAGMAGKRRGQRG